jgi:transcriptional regulator with XRE-family HTH domain
MSSPSKPFFLGPLYDGGMTIGKRIRQLRLTHKLTQEQLGEICDTTKGAVSQWESDQTMPTLQNVLLLCDRLTFTLDWLLRGAGMPDAPYETSTTKVLIVSEPETQQKLCDELLAIAKTMSERGLFILIDKASELALRFPQDQAKAA